MTFFRKLWLYYHTLRFLKISQIYSYILFYVKKNIFITYIIRKVTNLSTSKNPVQRSVIKKPYLKSNHNLSENTFSFLNKTVQFKKDISWNDSELTKLWLYNLHYFDYLIPFIDNKDAKFEDAKKVIINWINFNPVGYGNGWEPYPISLRIINWIFFYYNKSESINKDLDFKQIFLNSLYQQCTYLTRFIEYHIRANHLLKNGKALFFAGYFFENDNWIDKGKKIITSEIKEQILPDGGHFERSPMYHSIVLEDILDLLNLVSAKKIEHGQLSISYLKSILIEMFIWLKKMLQPDGNIPLFGDSAFAIAVNFGQLVSYYEEVCKEKLTISADSELESLDSSGYYIFRSSNQYLNIDGGKLGTDYQPGHAHCDLFSYEYSYKNERFIVDTGIGEYMNSELRQKARSLNGHNSVVVNDSDQAEIWDAFRMGRRVEPLQVETITENNNSKFSAIYENWLSKKKKYQHRREIEFIGNKFFHIKDLIKGNRISKTRNLIHFHPDCKLEIEGHGIKISRNENTIYILFSNVQISAEFKDWFYVPEFGKILPSQKVELAPKLNEKGYIPYLIVPSEFLKSAEQYLTDHLVN